MISQKIVLTGSHLTPALALKTKLQRQGWQVIELKVGSPKFNRHQPIMSSLSLIKLPFSLLLACKSLAKIKPKLVVSFGGYDALPVCLAAKLFVLPLIIHEQTFAAGLTSRLTAIIADKVAISWQSSQPFFPRSKTILTGNPIRRELLNIKTKKLKSIYITGGHQGSKI
ncbi:MAG: glycosyltransferase, partial [Patescibacteria group bacterium]|nr:glycosyltransferase [Patescibacteria group bacterium]